MVPDFHAVFSEARLINKLAEACSRLDTLEAELRKVKVELQLERGHRIALLGICCRVNSKVIKVGKYVGKWIGRSMKENLTLAKRLGVLESEIDRLTQNFSALSLE